MRPHHILDHLGDGAKHLLDAGAAFVALGALVKLLPSIASFLTIIWMLLRIYDWIEARWQGRKPSGD